MLHTSHKLYAPVSTLDTSHTFHSPFPRVNLNQSFFSAPNESPSFSRIPRFKSATTDSPAESLNSSRCSRLGIGPKNLMEVCFFTYSFLFYHKKFFRAGLFGHKRLDICLSICIYICFVLFCDLPNFYSLFVIIEYILH